MKKVILLAHHALGDLVMKAPMINYLKSFSNQYDLHITVRDETLKKFAEEFLNINKKNIHIINLTNTKLDTLKTLINLFSLRFDVYISPPSINRSLAKILSIFLLAKKNILLPHNSEHKIIENFQISNYMPFKSKDKVDFEKFYFLQSIKKSHEQNKIIIHPGSGETESFKQYPKEKWLEVIRNIHLRYPSYKIIITGHGNKEEEICKYLTSNSEGITNLAGKLSLVKLIDEINSCTLFISSDCGPSHIASILKKQQITIFGPTDPSYTGAYNTTVILSNTKPACSPCYGTVDFGTKGCLNNSCLYSVQPTNILASIGNLHLPQDDY